MAKSKFKFKKRSLLTNSLAVLAIGFVAITAIIGGYVNSRNLNVRPSDAYQGEPCTSTGLTKCSADGTKVEVCSGGIWNVSNCSTGRCTTASGPAACATPTPAPTTCSSGQTRCYSSTQVQVCSGGVWQNPTTCSTGICSGTSTSGACTTPTLAPTCSSGQTRCVNDTTLEVCSSGTWYTSTYEGRTCNSSTGTWSTPTPYPPIDGCFLAGTKVALLNGSKNIEEITTNDSVLSFNDSASDKVNNSQVSDIHEVTRDHYYKITAGKNTVSVTAEHPFYTGNGNYIDAQDIKAGTTVYLLTDNELKAYKVSNIVRVNETVKAYNLTVDSDHTFFANDFAVHNKLGQTPAEKCSALGISKGLLGAQLSTSFKYLSVKNNNYNYCKADELYLNWYFTSISWPPMAASCCVLPANNNAAQNNYCNNLTPAKVTSHFKPVSGVGFTEPKTEPLPNYTCSSSVDTCFSTYNYNPIINRNIASMPDGQARYLYSDLPTNTKPAKCNWLGGNTESSIATRYCCSPQVQ